MNMQQNNKRNKQLHSAITKLFFLDSGGDSHELIVASYALELTPVESAFNEANGS